MGRRVPRQLVPGTQRTHGSIHVLTRLTWDEGPSLPQLRESQSSSMVHDARLAESAFQASGHAEPRQPRGWPMMTNLAALAVSDSEIRAGMILAHRMAARMRAVCRVDRRAGRLIISQCLCFLLSLLFSANGRLWFGAVARKST